MGNGLQGVSAKQPRKLQVTHPAGVRHRAAAADHIGWQVGERGPGCAIKFDRARPTLISAKKVEIICACSGGRSLWSAMLTLRLATAYEVKQQRLTRRAASGRERVIS